MREKLILAAILLSGAACLADPAPAPVDPTRAAVAAPAPAAADPAVDAVLDALDQRGRSLREFTARVSHTSGDQFVDGVSTQVGQLYFQKIGDDDGRLHVVFDKRIDGKIIRVQKAEFLLDKGWLIDRDYRKTTETSRQVIKPGQKIDLLKLGEGPFPLPIGQKKEDVHRLFDVSLVAPNPKDGADLATAAHLRLTPRPDSRFARKFGAIDVWVDRKINFPVRIDTAAPDDSDHHTTRLENVQINPAPGLAEADFTLPKINLAMWSIHKEPFRE